MEQAPVQPEYPNRVQSSEAVYWNAQRPAILTNLTSTWIESPGSAFSKTSTAVARV
jgi:hypothetical protein